MIQDIGNHKINPVFVPGAVLHKEDYIIGFEGKNVYMRRQPEKVQLLTCEDILPIVYEKEAFEKYQREAIFLMRVDDRPLFLLPEKYLAGQPKVKKESIAVFRKGNPDYVAYAMISAYHLYHWYETTKFCGACGVRLKPGTEERSMVCPICGNVIYPRISPAVIAGIYHEDKILLTKYARKGANYALVAGYCEVGETIEETVHREVMEETGVKIQNLRYYKSQPWAFSQSILSGFFAELSGEEKIHLDTHELSLARWVSRDELEECGPETGVSLTSEMIEYFRTHPEEF